jgi:CRP-like cAMP-binding protein
MGQARRAVEDHVSLTGLWGMSAAHAAALGRHAKALHARRGEVIAHRGTPLPGIFVIDTGTVKLSLRGSEGEDRVLRVVCAGTSFGEPTALIGRPCQYDAYALTDVKYAVLPASAIFALVENDKRFARRLVLALAERSFTILHEFAAATTQRGAQRLASYLESLARQQSRDAVQLPVSKTVVAALLGMKKETLSRLLHQFAADGIITVARREIAILDRGQLVKAAHEGASERVAR